MNNNYNQILLSVIVPIYKVEPYLEKCINSIINQTYSNLEIILVDDGSPDKCGEICDIFSRNDSRIKVIHQQNQGLSGARNSGLDIAEGEYVTFVDSDDWIDKEMYAKLVELLEVHEADIVSGGVNYQCNLEYNKHDSSVIVYDLESAFKDLLNNHYLRFEVWNKIYKSKVIENVRFKHRQIHEDVHFLSSAFFNSKKIVHLDIPLYNYLDIRPGNTNSAFKENRLEIFNEFSTLVDNLRKHNMNDNALSAEILSLEYLISFYYLANSKNVTTELKQRMMNIFFNQYDNIKSSLLKRNKIKFSMFKFSPTLYCLLLDIKKKIIK